MTKIYIGIDTGRDTGFAAWDGSHFLEVATLTIHRAMWRVQDYCEKNGDDVTVYIEDARLRTWIPREKNLAEFKGRAQGAGSVKRDASVWEDFCKDLGVQLVKVPPKHNITKLKAEPFARITGWKGRTTEHSRDAAMLVFGK